AARRRAADPLVEEGAPDAARGRAAAPPAGRGWRLRSSHLLAGEAPRRGAGSGLVAELRWPRPRRGPRALVLRGQAPVALAPRLRLPAMERGRAQPALVPLPPGGPRRRPHPD